MRKFWHLGAAPVECEARVLGGADMFSMQRQKNEMNLGERHIEMARTQFEQVLPLQDLPRAILAAARG